MKKKIEVWHGDEYCTKISEIYDKSDFFHEVYSKAAQGVRDIVEATEKFHTRHHNQGRSHYERDNRNRDSGITEHMYLAGYPNNFIAFCAGRGQGKTSAMVSFSTAMRRLDEENGQKEFWGESIAKSDFYVLDPIDPTMMSQGDSILRIVISRMFECYDREEQRRRDWHSFPEDKEPELLNEFRQCYRSLDVLQKGRDLQDCYDDLEYIADLGDSSHMKETFQHLVSLFLDLISWEKGGKNQRFLVLQIDDADLNASNAYRIVEELRKYCVVPNVIILMATDFEQLELTVEKHFIEELEMLCRYKKGDQTVLGHCHKMMERYLDKLIPGARQIHLPLIDHYIKDHESELELSYHDKLGESYSGDYQDVLLRMIYKKTGLVLMKPLGYLHNLLPKTMRELTHMLAFLSDLDKITFEDGALSKQIQAWRTHQTKVVEYAAAEPSPTAKPRSTIENLAALELRRKNIDAFMLYLRHCWVKAALTEEQQAVVVPAMGTTTDMKIRRLLSDLRAYGVKKYGEIWENTDDEDNNRAGPQYVDVIKMLDRLKVMPDCTEEYCLIYISATILTLHMHLLAIQDLREGLEFKRLKQFVGDAIFPPGVGEYHEEGLQYDQFNIDCNFVPQLALGSVDLNLGLAHVQTNIAAQLLLTVRGTNDHVLETMFDGKPLGSRVEFLKIFWNGLDRTANKADSAVTTEILDIILSWDLQYHIRKRLLKISKDYQEKPWIPYETWLVRQVEAVDKVYEEAQEVLEFKTASAALKSVFSEEMRLLAALAIGNPAYAEKWWRMVKEELDENWFNVEKGLEYAVSSEGDLETQIREAATALTRMNFLVSSSGSGSDLVIDEKFLSDKDIFHGGPTPKDLIDHVAGILPNTMELDVDKLLTVLRGESEKIKEILAAVKDCRTKLKEIKLYCEMAPKARKVQNRWNRVTKTGGRQGPARPPKGSRT